MLAGDFVRTGSLDEVASADAYAAAAGFEDDPPKVFDDISLGAVFVGQTAQVSEETGSAFGLGRGVGDGSITVINGTSSLAGANSGALGRARASSSEDSVARGIGFGSNSLGSMTYEFQPTDTFGTYEYRAVMMLGGIHSRNVDNTGIGNAIGSSIIELSVDGTFVASVSGFFNGETWEVTIQRPGEEPTYDSDAGGDGVFAMIQIDGVSLSPNDEITITGASFVDAEMFTELDDEPSSAKVSLLATTSVWGFAVRSDGPLPGDVNDDDIADLDDLEIIGRNFDLETGATLETGDIDGDGDVDEDDLAIWSLSSGTLLVTTENDEVNGDFSFGDLSLREAMWIADESNQPGYDVIAFAPWVSEIDLTPPNLDFPNEGAEGELYVGSGNDLMIKNVFAERIAIDGQNESRIFNIGSNATVSLEGLVIQNGEAGGFSGGGIANQGNLTLSNSRVTSNHAASGGGISHSTGTLTIVNTEIDNNVAIGTGGGILFDSFELDGLTIDSSSIHDNSAVQAGGIYAWGDIDIRNTTISSNNAEALGGMVSGFKGGIAVYSNINEGHQTVITNSTIAYNTAESGDSAGLTVGTDNEQVPLILRNSIVAKNFVGITEKDVVGKFSSVSANNLIGMDSDTNNNLEHNEDNNRVGVGSAIDPLLTGLTGGPVPYHDLISGSQAINTGNNSYVNGAIGSTILFDQRGEGFSRIFNDASDIVDIGAIESGHTSQMGVGALADVTDGVYVDDEMSLREAIEMAELTPGPDTIYFRDSVIGETITLEDGQLEIASNVNIVGPGAGLLTIDADHLSRVFYVNASVTASISGLTIKGGSVSGSGGGVQNWGDLTLDHVVVTDNDAAEQGGGIYSGSGAKLHLVASTVSNNQAYESGGIKSRSSLADALVIESSAIINNTAETIGGIFVSGQGGNGDKTALIVNTTISGNSATMPTYGNSGAILVNSGFYVTVVNSTITNNSAAGDGGGIRNSGSTVTLHNTILAGNTANSSGSSYTADWYGTSAHAASSYNLIGVGGGSNLANGTNGNLVGNTMTPRAAGLTALADHGGPTWTHALLETSDAIDAGDNAIAITYGLLRDQRGGDYDRIVDWDNDDITDTIDIGALELAFDEVYS